MSDIDNPPGDSDEEAAHGIDVELGAETLRRVGMVMQYVGAVGAVVWALESYSTWDTFKGQGFSDGGFFRKLALVLGPFATLLLAALVLGLGTACRLLADWTLLRLAEDRDDIGPLPET